MKKNKTQTALDKLIDNKGCIWENIQLGYNSVCRCGGSIVVRGGVHDQIVKEDSRLIFVGRANKLSYFLIKDEYL